MSIRTQKGKPTAMCNGFVMLQEKKSNDGLRQYWRCSGFKSGCHGRAISAVGSTVLRESVVHDLHIASPAEVRKREVLTSVRDRAKESYASSSQEILNAAKNQLSEEDIATFPRDENVKRLVTNARKPGKGCLVDKQLDEMELSEEYKSTVAGGRFLLFDSRVTEPKKPVILIFASDRGLDFLRLYKNWAIDGTFFSCPKYFSQLFTVNVFKDDSTLPAVFLLLPNKSEDTYQRAFDALMTYLPDVKPDRVMSDFEKAPTNVLKEMFPTAIFSYCLFHLSQNLFKNFQKKGLIDLYANADVKKLVRCLNALAFLPTNEVASGFDEVVAMLNASDGIPQNKVQSLQEYINYVEKTYIRNIAEDGTVNLPLYPPSSWNCFNTVILGLPRTNNAMEGWHREFNRRFSKRHLGLSNFIIRIKQEEDATWKLAVRHAANPADPLRQKKSSKVENNERQINKLVRDYDAVDGEQRQRVPFLKAMQYHLAKFYQPERDGEDETAVEEPAVEDGEMNEEDVDAWLYNEN